MKSVKPSTEVIAEDEKKTWSKVEQIRNEIQAVINKLTPIPKPQPTLTLYEIRIDSTGTHLIEVPFNPTLVMVENSKPKEIKVEKSKTKKVSKSDD